MKKRNRLIRSSRYLEYTDMPFILIIEIINYLKRSM